MGTATVAARIALAMVFGVAALSKLLTSTESGSTFRDFGAGEAISRVGSALLVPAELLVAGALFITPAARWGAIAAAAMLVVFIAGITNALRQGLTPDCGCFGALRPTPIGPETLIRNAVLLAVAVFAVVWGPGPGLDSWLNSQRPAVVALTAAALVAFGFALLASLRAGTNLTAGPSAGTLRPSAVAVGDLAPDFSLRDERGNLQTLATMSAGGRVLLLVFVSSGCGPCLELLAEVTRWQNLFGDSIRIALVGVGDEGKDRTAFGAYPLRDVLTGTGFELQSRYGVLSTPAAVALAPDMTVASGVVVGKDAIEDVIRLTLRRFDPMYELWSLSPTPS